MPTKSPPRPAGEGGPGPVLSVRGLRFRYPGRTEPALHGVGFDLWPGEVLGVLGPNGSGKSTLLSAVLDVKKGHREGEVTLFGAPVSAGAGHRVGYATQMTALYLPLTVRENLVHAARLVLPRRRAGEAVRRSIEEFRLEGVLGRRVGELSGGWRRLVHIAASFVHEPPLRFLDEPTAALDFETRGRLVGLVADWAARGAAVVVTSHYPEDLEEMCTRLLVIRQGVVIRSATLADLLAGVSRRLVVEVSQEGRETTVTLELPARSGDLARDIAAALDAARVTPEARLENLRLTSANLRGLLTGDPRLTGVIVND